MVAKLTKAEDECRQLKEKLRDCDAEIRIMKREKDENINSRMEMIIENKKIKNELEKLQ